MSSLDVSFNILLAEIITKSVKLFDYLSLASKRFNLDIFLKQKIYKIHKQISHKVLGESMKNLAKIAIILCAVFMTFASTTSINSLESSEDFANSKDLALDSKILTQDSTLDSKNAQFKGFLQPNQKPYIRKFGDIGQFLPALSLGYTLLIKDFLGFKQQAISVVAVVIATYVIKYSFYGIAKINPEYAKVSKRPDSGKFEGFPSGHTAAAFSAAGFLQKRYGIKLGLPAVIISSVVGFSRVEVQRHTLLQVICGGLLGFFVSFLLTKPRSKQPPNINSKDSKLEYKSALCLLLLCCI